MDSSSENTKLDESVIEALKNHEVQFNVADWDRMESKLARIARQAPLGKSHLPAIGIATGALIFIITLYNIFKSSDEPVKELPQQQVVNNEPVQKVIIPVDTVAIDTIAVIEKEKPQIKKKSLKKKEKVAKVEITKTTPDTVAVEVLIKDSASTNLNTFDGNKGEIKIGNEKGSDPAILTPLLMPNNTDQIETVKKERKRMSLFKKNNKEAGSSDSVSTIENSINPEPIVKDSTSTSN